MSLLAGVAYDPSTAATKATTAVLAMTALDTTNLRLNFTVPSSGRVMVRMQGVLYGAGTFPQVLFGVLQSSTVMGRVAPVGAPTGTALATTYMPVEGVFMVTGLTPAAALTWDAAYSVDFAVASTNLKYGGPNDTTASNAWGAFCFEIWDVG
jgi:hypothetical protein